MDCKREDAENGSSLLEEQTETLAALLKNLYGATLFSAALIFSSLSSFLLPMLEDILVFPKSLDA